VLGLLASAAPRFDFAAGDVWSLCASLAFDVSVWELWGALLFGGCALGVPEHTLRDARALAQLLVSGEVTVLNQTPSAFGGLWRELVRPQRASALRLRWLIFAGELLDRRRMQEWFARRAPSAPRVVNMYGITETTVHASWDEVLEPSAAGPSASHSLGSSDIGSEADSFDPFEPADSPFGIGRGLPGADLRAVDREGHAAALGARGELWVGGWGVARGYWRRPGLTALRFVPDAQGAPGSRVYRSGDFGEPGASGALAYIGRGDAQVKLRGHRIELGEVASVLRAAAGVLDAAVRLRGGEDERGARLVAGVALGAERDAAELRAQIQAWARARLPAYMVPAQWSWWERLPLTASGKLDERALLQAEAELQAGAAGQDAAGAAAAAPRDETERQLAQLWARLLEVPQVGIHDDFFALGGHSLLAMRLRSEVAALCGVELPVAQVLGAATVAELAERVREQRAAQLRR
jgi:acyl-coenzyme A synthetase/AMP-(fatty) acid ligase